MRFNLEELIPSEYTPRFRLKLHLAFWPVLFFISLANVYLNIIGQNYLDSTITKLEVLIYSLVNNFLVIGFIMTLYFTVFKAYFQSISKIKRKITVLFLVLLYIIIYLYTILILEVLYRTFPHLKNYNYIQDFLSFGLITFRNSFWYIIYLYFPFLCLPIFFKYLVNVYYLKDKDSRLIIASKKNELQFLKDQIQPHFVFNMLNGVYALVVDSDPKSSVAILKLSEMLRFSLYQSNLDFIPIETEIAYIQNRIEIEKIYNGFSENNFKIIVSSEAMTSPIKPMILAKLFDGIISSLDAKKGCIELIISNLQDNIQIKANLKNSRINNKIENSLDAFITYLALQYPKSVIINKVILKQSMSLEIALIDGK